MLQDGQMEPFTRETIKIPSKEPGVNLDVWFYKPRSAGPWPVVVAGHGLSLVKRAGLQAFGEAWAREAGYASLILDFRCLGDSDGEPRNFVSIAKQTEDYKSVISWAHSRSEMFQMDKIVAFGSALSALNVADLVVNDMRIAGGMVHCPVLDGHRMLMSHAPNYKLVFLAYIDWIKLILGLKSPVWVKAVGKPGEFAFLTSPGSYSGFTDMWIQGGTPFTEAPNVVPARLAFEFMSSRQGSELKNARVKLLVVMPEDDDGIPATLTRDIIAASAGKAILVPVKGGHYDIMKGGKAFEPNVAAQIEFLKSLNLS